MLRQNYFFLLKSNKQVLTDIIQITLYNTLMVLTVLPKYITTLKVMHCFLHLRKMFCSLQYGFEDGKKVLWQLLRGQ